MLKQSSENSGLIGKLCASHSVIYSARWTQRTILEQLFLHTRSQNFKAFTGHLQKQFIFSDWPIHSGQSCSWWNWQILLSKMQMLCLDGKIIFKDGCTKMWKKSIVIDYYNRQRYITLLINCLTWHPSWLLWRHERTVQTEKC